MAGSDQGELGRRRGRSSARKTSWSKTPHYLQFERKAKPPLRVIGIPWNVHLSDQGVGVPSGNGVWVGSGEKWRRGYGVGVCSGAGVGISGNQPLYPK